MPAWILERLVARHVGPLGLRIERGECVCVRGASGSGKSLLPRAIANLDAHDGGTRCGTLVAVRLGEHRCRDLTHDHQA